MADKKEFNLGDQLMHVRLINGRHVVFRNGLPVRTALGTTLSTALPELACAIAEENECSLPGVGSPVSLLMLQATYLDFGSITTLDELRSSLLHHLENDVLVAALQCGPPVPPAVIDLGLDEDTEAWWHGCLTDCPRRTLVGLTIAAANTGSGVLGWLVNTGQITSLSAAGWLCNGGLASSPMILPKSSCLAPEYKAPGALPTCLTPGSHSGACPMARHLEQIRWFCTLAEEAGDIVPTR